VRGFDFRRRNQTGIKFGADPCPFCRKYEKYDPALLSESGEKLPDGASIMTRNLGGRPPKFTTANALAILARVASGSPRDEAAKLVGVSRSTLAEWLAKGKAGEPVYSDFARALRAVESSGGLGRLAGRIAGKIGPGLSESVY
jgi:hypothetical protein